MHRVHAFAEEIVLDIMNKRHFLFRLFLFGAFISTIGCSSEQLGRVCPTRIQKKNEPPLSNRSQENSPLRWSGTWMYTGPTWLSWDTSTIRWFTSTTSRAASCAALRSGWDVPPMRSLHTDCVTLDPQTGTLRVYDFQSRKRLSMQIDSCWHRVPPSSNRSPTNSPERPDVPQYRCTGRNWSSTTRLRSMRERR